MFAFNRSFVAVLAPLLLLVAAVWFSGGSAAPAPAAVRAAPQVQGETLARVDQRPDGGG